MVQKSANFVLFSKLPPKATMLKNLFFFFLKRKIEAGRKKSHTFHRRQPNLKLLCLLYATVRAFFFVFLILKVSETFALPSARPHGDLFSTW